MDHETHGDIKSIRVLAFTDRKEDWYEWSNKFRAIAEEKGYDEIMDGTAIPPDESRNLATIIDNDLRERLEDLRHANKIGYRDLSLATTGASYAMVGEAKSTSLPKGDLRLAWQKLMEKWDPKESEDKMDLLEKFRTNKLDDIRTDPIDWLTELERNIRELREVGHIVTDDDFLL